MEKSKLPSFIMKSSTQAFTREAWRMSDFSFFDWLHGIVYARWPYLYIGIGTGEHWTMRSLRPLVNWLVRYLKPSNMVARESDMELNPDGDGTETFTFADSYHGKVVPIENARQLVVVNEDVELPDLEHIIPYRRAKDIIFQHPDHIVVLDCPCRSARANPCLPLDVCLIVGEPFASFVLEHHPDRSRWIDQDEAVTILNEEEQRGHVHHAFFKDAMLGRFYAICNCCSCCCGAMQAHRNGTPMLASSGYLAVVDEVLCLGCGTCEELCQFGAIRVMDGIAAVDATTCMGCGVCSTHCEQGAVELITDQSKGVPLELFELIQNAAEVGMSSS